MNENTCLEFKNVSFKYPDKPSKKVLSNLSFRLNKGEILAILGPNGIGKTTIMNLVAGFIKPSAGNIIRNESPTKEIFSAIVPQEYSLLDWKTVSHNIGLSLLHKGLSEKQSRMIIDSMIGILKIESYKDVLPAKLSGGTKQRVAIARALAPNPHLLLLDEPFNSLDISTKRGLVNDIKAIIKRYKKSAIFVTHDIDEAISLADKIIIVGNNAKIAKTVINNQRLSKRNETAEQILSLMTRE